MLKEVYGLTKTSLIMFIVGKIANMQIIALIEKHIENKWLKCGGDSLKKMLKFPCKHISGQ